jgi:ComF family protein
MLSHRNIEAAINTALGFVYPEVCQICRAEHATPSQGYVCGNCWQNVRFIRAPFCERCGLPFEGEISGPFECSNCREMDLGFRCARSAVVAKGMTLEIIHRYKYQGAMWFEEFLAGLLIREASPALLRDRCNLIVPVPLHPVKQRERQFNQAANLAQKLGRATGIPVNENLLQRVEFTGTQTRLSRVERARNVRNAFAMRSNQRLEGCRIAVIDDVFTTGATTGACATMLSKSGAEDIVVWTVARGL